MASRRYYFSPALLRKNITRLWPVWAGYLFIMMLSLPASVYILCKNSARLLTDADGIRADVSYFILDSVSNAGLAMIFIFSAIVATSLFSYLYTGRSACFYHALPVKREGLFITNYISGLMFMLVPNIIAALATILAGAACGVSTVSASLQWLAVTSCMLLFFFSFAVLCAMLTGQLAAAPVFYLILNFYFMFMGLMVSSIGKIFVYGLHDDLIDFSRRLCPVAEFSDVSIYYHMTNIVYGNRRMLIIYTLAAIALAVIALALYKKRNVETAGDIICVRWLRPVFRWVLGISAMLFGGVMLSAYLFDQYSEQFKGFVVLMCIVCGLLGFFIAEMILKKTFRVFRGCYKESLIFLAVLAFVFAGVCCDVTGFESRVPDADEIAAVRLQAGAVLELDRQEDIEKVLQIHKTIIGKRGELREQSSIINNDGGGVNYHVRITYRLKNGGRLSREYTIPYSGIVLDDAQSPAHMLRDIFNEPENVAAVLIPGGVTEDSLRFAELTLYNDDLEEKQVTLTKAQTEALYRAVQSDIMSGAFRNVYEIYVGDDGENESFCQTIDFVYTDTYGGGYGAGSTKPAESASVDISYWSLDFNRGCSSILAALESFGIYRGGYRLMTWEEYSGLSQMQGY